MYNYIVNVKADVEDYIRNEIDLSDFSSRDELEEYLNETLFDCDSVTGNASGSYTFNRWQAEENLCHNRDLILDMIDDLGYDGSVFAREPEELDVLLRVWCLPTAIHEVLDEIEDELEDAFNGDE